MSGFLKITCTAADNVNVAFYQNAVPIIRELAIENTLGRDLTDIAVHLTAEPPFLTPGRLAHRTHHRPSRAPYPEPRSKARSGVPGRHQCLAAWRTAHPGRSRRRAYSPSRPSRSTSCRPRTGAGVNSAPELLAAFVRPTDPSVDVILREASDKLAAAGRDEAMDGYRKGTKARAWEIADAIWAALVSHSIAYVLPPKSFERSGQMVRGPGDILSRKVGTCLDLTLLYASCLEQAGLNPVLALTEGHAFVGIWLVDEDFSGLVIDDPQMLRKRVQLEEMVVVETTLLTGSHPARFKQAVEAGQKADRRGRSVAVRTRGRRAARPQRQDSPARSFRLRPSPPSAAVAATVTAQEVGEIPQFEEDLDKRREPAPERNLDRLEIWKRNLLDLTLQKPAAQLQGLEIHHRDRVPGPWRRSRTSSPTASASSCSARPPCSTAATGATPRCSLTGRTRTRRKDFILDAMKRGDLHANVAETELEGRLTDLYRASRLAFEEGGANILYLCLGFLKWTPQDGAGPYRAPLILIPVQLERKSVRSGFRLALHEDEARFNPTLMQMLKQDFDLSMPEFDVELPQDASGIDVAGIWKIGPPAHQEHQGLGSHRAGHARDAVVHQIPDVEGPRRPHRPAQAQSGRAPT